MKRFVILLSFLIGLSASADNLSDAPVAPKGYSLVHEENFKSYIGAISHASHDFRKNAQANCQEFHFASFLEVLANTNKIFIHSENGQPFMILVYDNGVNRKSIYIETDAAFKNIKRIQYEESVADKVNRGTIREPKLETDYRVTVKYGACAVKEE